jgi:L-lactate dehydrogenase
MVSPGKITIVGAGHVGSHCALALAAAGVAAEVVLVDKNDEKARAQAWDVADALSFPPSATRVRAGTYHDCSDAEIVVIAIGEPRLPGQTRLDLLDTSVKMLHGLVETLVPLRPAGLVLTITNPADIVADYVRKGLGLPRSRVFGTGTLLDTARMVRLVSERAGVGRADVRGYVLGEHGDSSVFAASSTSVAGQPFSAFPGLDSGEIQTLTRQTGMDIVIGKGSTEFGIGQSVAALCGAILKDEQRVFPLSVLLDGEYGQSGVHAGVPCVAGRRGIESIVELSLTGAERDQLAASCDLLRKHIVRAEQIAPLGVLHA